MCYCARNRCKHSIPGHFLLHCEAGVRLRNVVQVDEGDRVVHVCCRVVRNDVILTDGRVNLPDENQRHQEQQIKGSCKEDRLVSVNLAQTVLLLAVGVRDKRAQPVDE